MSIHEIMTANVVKLKKEIIDAIDSLLIGKGAEEIELEDTYGFDDYISYKYNIKTKSITFDGTDSFDILDGGVDDLMGLLDRVEREDYQIIWM